MTPTEVVKIDHGDGSPVRLAAPFDNLEVVYPFAWHKPGRVHLYDRLEMSGTVYSPEYAWALAVAIVQAMGGHVLTEPEAELAADGLGGISSGDAGSYPPEYAARAAALEARLMGTR